MKRLLVLASFVALALPAAALAKGPSEASLTGPGISKAVIFSGTEQPGSALGDLAQDAGFYPAVFERQPDPMLPARPKGDLGPKYTIDYTVPGGDTTDHIKQNAYPYAKPHPVTYLAPGQKIFDSTTRGGWYTDELDVLRDRLGLPKTAPTVRASSSAGFLSTGRLGAVIAIALLLGASAWYFMRRRPRTVPA